MDAIRSGIVVRSRSWSANSSDGAGVAEGLPPSPTAPRRNARATLERSAFIDSVQSGIGESRRPSRGGDTRGEDVAQLTAASIENAPDIIRDLSTDPSVRAKRRLFAFRRFYQDVSVPILIACAFLVLTLPKASTDFLTRRWVLDSLDLHNLEKATEHFSSLWDWADARLVNTSTLFPASFSLQDMGNNDAAVPGLLQLGPVRIRQQRSRVRLNRGLPFVSGGNEVLAYVDERFQVGNSDVSAFGQGTAEDIFAANVNKSAACDGVWDPATNNPWVYHVDSDTGLSRNFEHGAGVYDGHVGYDALLLQNQLDANRQRLTCLRETGWIDKSMRGVVFEIPFFNMNTGLFTAILIYVSHIQTGQIEVRPVVESASLGYGIHDKLLLYLEEFDYPGFRIFCVAMVQLISILFSIALKITSNYRANRKYYTLAFRLDFLYDLIIALCIIIMLYFDIRASRLITRVFNDNFRVSTAEYVPLSAVLDMVDSETRVLAAVSLLVGMRMLAHCLMLPVCGPLIIAIFYTLQSSSVLTFVFLLIYTLCAFLVVFKLMFAQVHHASGYAQTGSLLFQMMSEEWSSSAVEQFQRPQGYYLTLGMVFMVVVPIILMNLFISVLSEVYPSEKARAERLYEDQITLASQEEHVKRTNPILKLSRPRNRFLRFFHTMLVRPTLERGVTFFSWLLPPTNNTWDNKNKAFGWTRGGDQMQLHLARRTSIASGTDHTD